jgi:hypothetical protein
MIILYRQQFLHAGLYPLLFFFGTTVRAMPVSAAMILILYVATIIIRALIHMIAKRCCRAVFNALQNSCGMSIFIEW